MTDLVPDPGSFRDPSGRVVLGGVQVFRGVDEEFASVWDRAVASGVIMELSGRSLIVPTERIPGDSEDYRRLSAALPDYPRFFRHSRIPVLTYPYEWSLGMLADAGILMLEIEEALVRKGFSLKDASAFNVQFDRARPVFIDITSIEVHRRKDLWTALHQFQKMFVYPLLLRRYRGLDHKSYFLPRVDGMDLFQMRSIFRGLSAFSPGLIRDVGLPSLLSRPCRDRRESLKDKLREEGGNPDVLLYRLEGLKVRIRRLARYRPSGSWKDYTKCNSYPDFADNQKAAFVSECLERCRPESVLDLGCNTGCYSRLAARAGARVIALDGDHDCIELLYRESKESGLNILPVWADLANPSPGIGFRNRERAPLLDRIPCDTVMALALVHHLLVASRIPLEEIRDMLRSLTRRHLLVEYVEPSDQKFQELLGLRENLYSGLTLRSFENIFSERFRVLRKISLAGTHRHLLHLEVPSGEEGRRP